MKENKLWFACLALVVATIACAIGSPSMKSPSSDSKENIPLYSNLKEISLDEEDKRLFVADVLGYENLLYVSTTDISWSDDTGADVTEQLDTKLPIEKWRIETDWVNWGNNQLLMSEWKKGDLILFIIVFDNLSSEDISGFNKKYGITDLTPGSTLVLSHAIDKSQVLPNTTATAQVKNQSTTATAEFASFSASATAETINNSVQATQFAKVTAEANIALQSQLEIFSETFNSSKLSDKWTIYRPDPTRWDLTSEPGFLHIIGSPTRDAGILNIFGMRVTYSDIAAITRIESTNMLKNRQSAWIAFSPDDYSNAAYTVELGISFDRYDGYQIYMWQCQYDNCSYGTTIGEEKITYEGVIYLMLARVGNNYYGYYSYDGSSWIFVGEKKDFPLITDQVILGAGRAKRNTDEFDSYFDYLYFGVP